MAEILHTYEEPAEDDDGSRFMVRACGRQREDGIWEGWLEFVPDDGSPVLRSERETTQSDREDLEYWATGLGSVYLQGALHRASEPRQPVLGVTKGKPAYAGPAPPPPSPERAVLDPFAVYASGEGRLRKQLNALSPPHLVRIIRSFRLADEHRRALEELSKAELVELIVEAIERTAPLRAGPAPVGPTRAP